jgi:hypothetical protein
MKKRESAPETRRSTLHLKLSATVRTSIRTEAKRRGVEADDLAAEIIDTVVSHGLYAAVLDH